MNNIDEKYRQSVIETLKTAITFFEENHLSYFMACGSALGAARHQGMIPWDDDTDIYMFRDDYNKLLGMRRELQAIGLDVAYLEKGKDYYAPFAKVYNKGMSLWETPLYPYIIGSFIDVFPLDGASCGMQRIGTKWSNLRAMFNQYRNTIESHSRIEYAKAILKGQFVDVTKWIVKRIVYRQKRDGFIEEMAKLEGTLNERKLDLYVSYTETQQYVFPQEWFAGYIEVPFEDFKVRLPQGYKEYLTYFYGDYMTLPPVEKRNTTHEHYYLNFSEHLTVNVINKRIKKGKKLNCKI